MEFVEQLKSQIDIVSVVREYVPSLKKAGTRYIGLCPFHQEKTPSFGVHPVHQFYKCFGCGAGGDVIKFVMELEGWTFWEAVTKLAESRGIPVPRKKSFGDEETSRRTALYEMHEIAGRLFRQALEAGAGAAARRYLEKRGVDGETAAEFGIGFAERSGAMLVRAFEQHGFSPDQMAAGGLVLRRQEGGGFFDRFRGRLMFPIHNESGRIIAFAGRAMSSGEEPKYMNSPETPIYRKSYVLYNLNRARKQIRERGRAILVEGYMDVIGLYQAGVREALASCGTALTAEQVRGLRRHSEKVIVNFDPDAAGAKAAERSIQMLLEEGANVRVLQLPGGLDPDEFVRERGADEYLRQLQQAPGCIHWLTDRARASYDMSTAQGRVDGFRNLLLPAIERLPRRLERAAVASEVATYLKVDPALVRQELRRAARTRNAEPVAAPGDYAHPKEKLLINLLLKNAEARREVMPRLGKLRIIERFRTWPVLRVMLQLEEKGGEWAYAELEGRLEEEGKTLLASIVFADALEETEESSLEQALAFLPALERQERAARLAELKEQIRTAETAGDTRSAIELMAELNRIAAD